jgi:hypothetical protein
MGNSELMSYYLKQKFFLPDCSSSASVLSPSSGLRFEKFQNILIPEDCGGAKMARPWRNHCTGREAARGQPKWTLTRRGLIGEE